MLNPVHLRDHVIRPVLHSLTPRIKYSLAAEHLLLGTAAQESKLVYLHQTGEGPAIGLWQMEPNTYKDIWENYLKYNTNLVHKLRNNWMLENTFGAEQMHGNLYFACAMARIHYFRMPQALPAPGDVYKLAQYWKSHYNTQYGSGTIEQFIDSWKLVKRAAE